MYKLEYTLTQGMIDGPKYKCVLFYRENLNWQFTICWRHKGYVNQHKVKIKHCYSNLSNDARAILMAYLAGIILVRL